MATRVFLSATGSYKKNQENEWVGAFVIQRDKEKHSSEAHVVESSKRMAANRAWYSALKAALKELDSDDFKNEDIVIYCPLSFLIAQMNLRCGINKTSIYGDLAEECQAYIISKKRKIVFAQLANVKRPDWITKELHNAHQALTEK